MRGHLTHRMVCKVVMCVTSLCMLGGVIPVAAEPLIIAASPSLKAPLEALGRGFEATHPHVRVQIHYDSGLGLRQMIGTMQSSGRHFIGSGPVHIIAPAGLELIERFEQRYYVLPGTRRAYATVPLVLVVPESLAEAHTSFEAFAHDPSKRLSVADPQRTELGLRTQSFLQNIGLADGLKGRLDEAHDARGVIDHVLNGSADAGIVFGSDAVRERERVRVAATSTDEMHRPIVYWMAMERFCPNRAICEEFLAYAHSSEAQGILKSLGYGVPDEPGESLPIKNGVVSAKRDKAASSR